MIFLKYKKKYTGEHKELIAEQAKTCYDKTKESMLAQTKEYYKHNIDVINARRYVRVMCDVCCIEYTKGNNSQHFKSLNHKTNSNRHLL